VILVVIVVVVLFGIAGALIASALIEPRVRRSENLAGIADYGYTGAANAPAKEDRKRRQHRPARESFDDLATSIGDLVARYIVNFHEEVVQRELISAGFFRVTARRFLGYRALLAILLPILFIWLFSSFGASAVLIILGAGIGFVAGWVGPGFIVHRRARLRLEEIDRALPGMIDLLVVTLEAGVAFSGALRLAAQRLTGPLGEEIRLTIQEQSLGLSLLESFENWQRRCDTPSVRSFVRAMVQGDRLGVSIGQILRNQAIEIRARQRQMVEERAQKAPVKILFPLVFLIFPAMFVVILAPALFSIVKSLKA
jgi:tight adherence protein C